MTRLDAIKQRLAAATPGPWHVMNDGFGKKAPTVYATDDDLRYIAACADFMEFHSPTPNLKNAQLIAHAPDDLCYLLDLVETLKEALEYVKRVTYGTELCNSDEENNEILARHFFDSARVARETLAKIEGSDSNPVSPPPGACF